LEAVHNLELTECGAQAKEAFEDRAALGGIAECLAQLKGGGRVWGTGGLIRRITIVWREDSVAVQFRDWHISGGRCRGSRQALAQQRKQRGSTRDSPRGCDSFRYWSQKAHKVVHAATTVGNRECDYWNWFAAKKTYAKPGVENCRRVCGIEP
jgi:hypothetical protein